VRLAATRSTAGSTSPPATVGAEQVLDEDALVAALVHRRTEDGGRVPGAEPDSDRLRAVEGLERPALDLRAADLDRPVGQPDHVDMGVGHEVVSHVGVDHPGEGEPVAEVVGHGNGPEPRPLRRIAAHEPVGQKRPAAPHLREGGRLSGRRSPAPVMTSPPATQGIRSGPDPCGRVRRAVF